MEYLLVGKYVNTHGIKGEIRIISDFRYKTNIFVSNMAIYIGKKKQCFIIKGYRKHKEYDMLSFDNINNINDIESLKGSLIYINKDDLIINDNLLLVDDLINYDVNIDNQNIGKVIEIIKSKANDVLVVSNKRILIPYVKDYIIDIDSNTKTIIVKNVRGLLYED